MPWIPIGHSSSRGYASYPNVCCRCVARPADRTHRITGEYSYNFIIYRSRHYYSTEVPVCNSCYSQVLADEQQVSDAKFKAAVVTTAITTILALVYILSQPHNVDLGAILVGALLFGVLPGLVLSIPLSWVIQWQNEDKFIAHFTNRGKSVRFTNPDYQRLIDNPWDREYIDAVAARVARRMNPTPTRAVARPPLAHPAVRLAAPLSIASPPVPSAEQSGADLNESQPAPSPVLSTAPLTQAVEAQQDPASSWGPVLIILALVVALALGVRYAVDGQTGSRGTPQAIVVNPSPTPTLMPMPSPIPARDFVVALDGWKCSTNQQGQTTFTGQVKNYGRQPINMVELRVSLFDEQNREVNSNTGTVDLSACLKQDETARFTVQVSNPQMAGKRCRIKTETATFVTVGSSTCPSGSTSTGKATAPASGSVTTGSAGLLTTMTRIRKNIQALAQDYEVEVHCERNYSDSVLTNYEAVTNAPKFNTTGATQAAYNDYRTAVDIIARTNKDLYLHCTAWVNGTATSNVVARQTWGTARQGVDEALQALDAGIAKLK